MVAGTVAPGTGSGYPCQPTRWPTTTGSRTAGESTPACAWRLPGRHPLDQASEGAAMNLVDSPRNPGRKRLTACGLMLIIGMSAPLAGLRGSAHCRAVRRRRMPDPLCVRRGLDPPHAEPPAGNEIRPRSIRPTRWCRGAARVARLVGGAILRVGPSRGGQVSDVVCRRRRRSDRGESPHRSLWRPAYAESDDGVDWIKPNLGLVEHRGSTANNLILTDPAPLGILNLKVLADPDDSDPGATLQDLHPRLVSQGQEPIRHPGSVYQCGPDRCWKLVTEARPVARNWCKKTCCFPPSTSSLAAVSTSGMACTTPRPECDMPRAPTTARGAGYHSPDFVRLVPYRRHQLCTHRAAYSYWARAAVGRASRPTKASASGIAITCCSACWRGTARRNGKMSRSTSVSWSATTVSASASRPTKRRS